MGLPRDYDPKKHGYIRHPKGGEFFHLDFGGKIWASANLSIRQIASLACPHPRDRWSMLSLFEVSLAMDGQVHYHVHFREQADIPEVVRSVSLKPKRPVERLELRDVTAQLWGVVEIDEAVRLFDPSGRLRACMTVMPGQLALQCWDEHGKEVAGQEYMQV